MMSMLGDLQKSRGKQKRKRVGRGRGSGHGKTSCRGHKGQNSRSGGGVRPGFEGGQMPLQRRLPKRGFHNPFSKVFALVNVGELERFESGSKVDVAALIQSGLVKKIHDGVKILGNGEIKVPLHVKANKFSKGAIQKIEGAGGTAEVI